MIASPYQSYAWYTAWLATAGAQRREEPVIIVAFDSQDRPIAILPLIKRRTWGGLVVCEFAGGRHSNANLGLFAPPLSGLPDARTMRWVLRETTRRIGQTDIFCFANVPLYWRGQETWITKVGGQPSPSSVHATTLACAFAEWQATHLSASRRKNCGKVITTFVAWAQRA